MGYEWICLKRGCLVNFTGKVSGVVLSDLADQVYQLDLCGKKDFLVLDFSQAIMDADGSSVPLFAGFLATYSNTYQSEDFHFVVIGGPELIYFVEQLNFYMSAFNSRWKIKHFPLFSSACRFLDMDPGKVNQGSHCHVFKSHELYTHPEIEREKGNSH